MIPPAREQLIKRLRVAAADYWELGPDFQPRATQLLREAAAELAVLAARVGELESAIREHRDARGDDRCWMDDEALYGVLPEGYTPPTRDSAVELARCEQFIASRHNPATVYVSPQRQIEAAEAHAAALAPYLQHKQGCTKTSLAYKRSEMGYDMIVFPDDKSICTCGLDQLVRPSGATKTE